MLKPITAPASSFAGCDVIFTPDIPLTPFQSIAAARLLHEALMDEIGMASPKKRSVARQISGHLFDAEADRILPEMFRALFVRLRTDSYLRAGSIDSLKLCRPNQIILGYDEIQEGLKCSPPKFSYRPSAIN
jgi:hypothetical protein